MALFDGAFDPFTGGILGRQPPPQMAPGYGVGQLFQDYFKGLFPQPPQVEAQFPQTNQMPPAAAPTSQQQQPPSSQPGGVQHSAQPGPPLDILAGADMSGNAALPTNSTPTQGFSPQEQQQFANPFAGGDILSRLARGLSIINPQAGQAYYGRQMQEAQYNALMRDPNMTPGRAIAMIQNPAVLQNYYDTKSLGPIEAGPVKGQLVMGQGQVAPFMPSAASANDIIRQQEAAKAQGTAQGTALAGLPNTHALFDKGLEDIDALIKDPNLKTAVGLPGELMTRIPGTAAQGIKARLDQLHGEASLAGLQYLQKIGRLNINEFNAGANAIARLGQAQNYNDMIAALQDLRRVFVMARTRSGETAGVGSTPPQQMNTGQFSQEELTAEARRRGLIQ